METTKYKKIGVVFNPGTGANVRLRRRRLENALARYDTEVVWRDTDKADKGKRAAQEVVAEDVEVVLAVGGDGTISAVAGELVSKNIALGIIPVGTSNAVARNLGLPERLETAVKVALGDKERAIDVGSSEHGYFLMMGGIGMDAALVHDANVKLKAHFGPITYFFSALKHLRRHRIVFDLTIDGVSQGKKRGSVLLVGNFGNLLLGRYAKIPLLTEALPDDGKLDVIVIKAHSFANWFILSRDVLLRRARKNPDVSIWQAESVEIHMEDEVLIEWDGDGYGFVSDVKIELLKKALLIKVS